MTTPAMEIGTPQKPANMTHEEWTESLPDSTVKSGRLDVEGAPELQRMRATVKTLAAHAQVFQNKIDAIKANQDLSAEGRDRQIRAIEDERETRIAKIVRAEYDSAEAHLMDRFADTEPVNLPVQPSDAQRAILFMNKIDRLSPEKALAEFQKVLQATTNEARILVQEILPIFEDYTETKESWRRDLPMDQVTAAIRDARVDRVDQEAALRRVVDVALRPIVGDVVVVVVAAGRPNPQRRRGVGREHVLVRPHLLHHHDVGAGGGHVSGHQRRP